MTIVDKQESDCRHSSLDISRFLAALIVFLGHFLWFDQRFENLQGFSILEILRTGDQSVLYFFTLSGFVLSISTSRIDLNWLKARFVRLMPVYIVCFLVPLIAVRLMAPEEFNTYPSIGICLGIFGIQAIFTEYYLAGANSPLWSLSVEIILSIGLVVLSRISSIKFKILLIALCEIFNHFIFQPVINGLSFFLIGITFYKISKLNSGVGITSSLKVVFCGSSVFLYWVVFPLMGISINASRYVDLIGTTATLVFFDSIHLSSKIKNLSEYLGKRTYSLYAVHAPILRFHAESFQGLVGNDKYFNNSVVYFVSAIIIVAISTELLFRLIEKPSVDYAKKIRYSKRI